MGNPKDDNKPRRPPPSPFTPHGDSTSSISMHTPIPTTYDSEPPLQRYFDDDPAELSDSDLPPLYSAVAPSADGSRRWNANDGQGEHHGLFSGIDPLRPAGQSPLSIAPFKEDRVTGTKYYMDPRLDSDPIFLEEQLRLLAAEPPRPMVHIRGTHSETVHKKDSTENRTVVDFDITLELTYLLYGDAQDPGSSWRRLETPSNFEKVRRGTVRPTRAGGFGGSGPNEEEGGQPDLTTWCHRYAAQRGGLKRFVLTREVVGWDFAATRRQLEALVRASNYQGNLTIEFPVRNARAEVWNSCLTNRWRLTRWIEVLFMLSLLFVFAWPWVYLRTRVWEVAGAQWRFSRTEVEDEQTGRTRLAWVNMRPETWYNIWARPLLGAVLERRQGSVTQRDLPPRRSSGSGTGSGMTREEREETRRVDATREGMANVDRSFGWGAR